ncbi:hypothetical protein HPB48_000563 [Haemaphysalis longicornis]|uniref:Uncharacterized protein n=1 Tax=Haemaphysalis longicornis TaxID=44386 RepID=A0A9J6H4T0_HAELO|nr:hypothetical protein HPB48_000563 [Haemaphysalis longicornis]
MKAFSDYYRTVFQTPKRALSEDSIDKFISLLPKLNQDECESIDQDIDIQELVSSIESLSKGKTPGPDGLTA